MRFLPLPFNGVGCWRDHAGDNAYFFILFQLFVYESEGLLENDCVFVAWVCVASEAEIGKAVYDKGAFVFFNALQRVGMMPQNEIGTFIYGIVR